MSFEHAVARDSLTAATDALAHRGPDGRTVWLSADGHVGLGHTRLGINDLGATQPIASEDERYRIVANGEFYDFEAIRAQLERGRHRFRTGTDSEIALHLYEDLGVRSLERLRGEYAFVVWDGEARMLFAARDRFGIKPLYYAQRHGALYLASEAKALFAAGLPAAWDEEAVFAALHACYRPDHSLFDGVRQLPPGHYLTADRQGVRVRRYWHPAYPPKRSSLAKGEFVEEVRRLLDESVRLRMRADVPVGYLLSGGLDSSALLGIGAAHGDGPRRAFTIGFASDRYDESAIAREAAAHSGAELEVVLVTEDDFAEHFADCVWHGEGMQYNAHGVARYVLSREIQRSGYRSVMGGEGADELFAGYGFVRNATDASRSSWLRVLGPLDDTERALARVSPLLARTSRLVSLPPWTRARALEWLQALHSVLSPEFVARQEGHDPFARLVRSLALRPTYARYEGAKKILYLWLRSAFANYHLGADRIDMAHGVEVRLPYLDHELFEFVRHIPVGLLTMPETPKQLLREVARPYVADAIYRGPKRPFYAPPSAVRRGSPLHELVRESLLSSRTTVPFIDQRVASALIARLDSQDESRRATLDPILMIVASLTILHDRFRL